MHDTSNDEEELTASNSEAEADEDEFVLTRIICSGKLKPGLNVAKKQCVNQVSKLKEILSQHQTLYLGLKCQQPRRISTRISHRDSGIRTIRPEWTIRFAEFERQAQLAAIEGIARLKSQGIPTLRPDDYFAEMMKSDEHMQKVRRSLLEKQAGLQRSEKVKKIREHKKIAKQKQIESTLQKHKEKRGLNEEIKKYRKGLRTDLDFLDKPTMPKFRKGNKDGAKPPNKWKKLNNAFKNNNSNKKFSNKINRPGKERRKNMKNKKR